MISNQAIQIKAPEELAIISYPPKKLMPDEARLKVEAIGICASDVAVLKGTHPLARYPVVSGHELSGLVEEVNGGAPFAEGDRVAINPIRSCGACPSCLMGNPNRCREVQVMGVHQDGGMAERINVPVSQLHLAPPELDAGMAAMIEPAAVAVHVCNRSQMKAGDSVAIVGTGVIGLLILEVAQARGAGVLFGVDVVQERLDRAQRMGANATGLATDQALEEIAAELSAEGFDIVFDTAGGSESLLLSTKLARAGGIVVPVALPHANLPIDLRPFYLKELTLKAARMYTDEFEEAGRLIASGAIEASTMITHRLPLEEAAEAFELAGNHPSEAVKVMIQIAQP